VTAQLLLGGVTELLGLLPAALLDRLLDVLGGILGRLGGRLVLPSAAPGIATSESETRC
jgi:hypothetical protein